MDTLSPRLRRLLFRTLVGLALLLNVYTLSPLADDGQIAEGKRIYIWLFDIYVLLAAAALQIRWAPAAQLLKSLLIVLAALLCIETSSIFAWRYIHKGWHFDRHRPDAIFVFDIGFKVLS